METLPSTTEEELVNINYIQHPAQPTLIDFKFVFYKFPNPIKKNIESLKVLLTNSELLRTTGIYVSLYANCFQLTTPIKIYPNTLTEILQFKYLPSQLISDYQIQLVVHIDNMHLLNNDDLPTSTIKDILQIDVKLTIKYFLFKNPETIDKLSIYHNDDVRSLVVKNKKFFYIKTHV
jgi:hypothetical protein